MSSSKKKFQKATQSEEKSMYPSREQFVCLRCKDKIFTSWNDFENHHAKHAVDFTFSQLPVVKLQRIQILSIKSGTQNSSSIPSVNRNICRTSPNPIVSQYSKDVSSSDDKESDSSEGKPTEHDELLTWPGSCESPSPVASPHNTSICASNEIISPVSTVAGKPDVDPSVLDPAFIEKLGEEISFLNQSLVDSVTQAAQNKPLLDTIQPADVNLSSSSKSPTASEFQATSVDIPLIKPIIPEIPITEKNLALCQPSEDKPVGPNEKDTARSENESVSSPKEIELPKSKGQLRLVPFESLLSPSRLPVDRTEHEEASQTPTSISPSKSQNKQHVMVVIPERNLTELNISGKAAPIAISESLISSAIKNVTDQQQARQISGPNLTPAVTKTVLPSPIPSILPLPQRHTHAYQFHHAPGQGQHPPQVYQQLQQHQQQQQQHQQQQQQHQQQQQQHQQQQQQHQQQQQQRLQQQHQQNQTSNTSQYHQQPPAYRQQMVASQQPSPYATAPQYAQRFSNQRGMQYPPNMQSYTALPGAIQPNDFSRASVSSAMAFASSHGSAQIHPAVSTTNYLQQTLCNPIQAASSSSHPRCQFSINSGMYNPASQHTNTTLPHYLDRPSAPIVHHVQLQIPTAPSVRPSGSITQNVRQQTMVPPAQQAHRHPLTNAPGTSVRPQQVSQQRPRYILSMPLPSESLMTFNSQQVGTSFPSTSAASDATSSAPRLSTPKYPGQQTSSTASRPVTKKRPLTVEAGTPLTCQPPRKLSRTEEAVAVSTSQPSGDCEMRIVQKKQTGLPVIQSVEGGVNPSVTKASPQTLQTPSVASLLSNPNITVTPAKNKENQAASEIIAALKATSAATLATNGNTRTAHPITIDLTNTASPSVQQRNPLQCQVCNETFSSQSLLKNHLVLHLRKVHPATIRPTGSQPVARNMAPDQVMTVNSPTGRTYPSNQRVRTSETITPERSGCLSTTGSFATSKEGPHPSSVPGPMTNTEASSSSSFNNAVSIEKLVVDSSASRTHTLSSLAGQSSSVAAAGTSGNASITNTPETGRQGPHSPTICKTTAEVDSDAANRGHQSKTGEALRAAKQNRPADAMPLRATSSVQSSSKEGNSPPVEKATLPNNDFFIPVVDLRRQDVITQLESMGINQFIPASNLTSSTNNDFAIPIMSATSLRRAGTTGFPNLCGAINLGSPKPFPSTSK